MLVLVLLSALGGSELGRPVTAIPALAGLDAARAATIYYVSNDGDDDDSGMTPGTAWQTIEHVNGQTFEPGDSILFRRGDTWRETLRISSSGTPSSWITFGAYGEGGKPRLLGSEQAVGWTEVAPNVWRSSTSLNDPYLDYDSNGEVYFEEWDGTTSWGDQQAYRDSFSNMIEEYDWSWNANTIYVRAPSNPASRYAAVEVPQRDSVVRFPEAPYHDPVEYVTIDNLEIMYAMRHGIYPGYNEVEVEGLRITNNHIGFIGVKGGRSAYCIAAWHSDMLIQGNRIHDCGRRGVSLNTYTTNTPDLTVSDVTIDSNHFYNGFHTTSVDVSSLPGLGHTVTNFTFSNNLVDDTGRWGSGIHDGCFASSCTSNSLYVQSNGNHYFDFYIYNNVIVGSTSRAILLRGDMDAFHIYHNTIYSSHPDAQPYGLMILKDVTNVDMRNNLFHGTLLDIGNNNYGRCVLDEGATSFSDRDYNLYHQEDLGQPLTGSEHGFGGWNVFIDDWDWWRAGSGFESHSPNPQDPLLVYPEDGDFNLQLGSPAIDAGALIPGFNDDYRGLAPDLGALEFTPSLMLHAAPADQAIRLRWDVNATLPATAIWRIDYYTQPTNILTATEPLSTTRSHTLTGLTNYEWYTVTLHAMAGPTSAMSDTVHVMPTDIAVYLPLIEHRDTR